MADLEVMHLASADPVSCSANFEDDEQQSLCDQSLQFELGRSLDKDGGAMNAAKADADNKETKSLASEEGGSGGAHQVDSIAAEALPSFVLSSCDTEIGQDFEQTSQEAQHLAGHMLHLSAGDNMQAFGGDFVPIGADSQAPARGRRESSIMFDAFEAECFRADESAQVQVQQQQHLHYSSQYADQAPCYQPPPQQHQNELGYFGELEQPAQVHAEWAGGEPDGPHLHQYLHQPYPAYSWPAESGAAGCPAGYWSGPQRAAEGESYAPKHSHHFYPQAEPQGYAPAEGDYGALEFEPRYMLPAEGAFEQPAEQCHLSAPQQPHYYAQAADFPPREHYPAELLEEAGKTYHLLGQREYPEPHQYQEAGYQTETRANWLGHEQAPVPVVSELYDPNSEISHLLASPEPDDESGRASSSPAESPRAPARPQRCRTLKSVESAEKPARCAASTIQKLRELVLRRQSRALQGARPEPATRSPAKSFAAFKSSRLVYHGASSSKAAAKNESPSGANDGSLFSASPETSFHESPDERLESVICTGSGRPQPPESSEARQLRNRTVMYRDEHHHLYRHDHHLHNQSSSSCSSSPAQSEQLGWSGVETRASKRRRYNQSPGSHCSLPAMSCDSRIQMMHR